MPLVERQQINQLVSLSQHKHLDKLLQHEIYKLYLPNLKEIVLFLYKKEGKSSMKFSLVRFLHAYFEFLQSPDDLVLRKRAT